MFYFSVRNLFPCVCPFLDQKIYLHITLAGENFPSSIDLKTGNWKGILILSVWTNLFLNTLSLKPLDESSWYYIGELMFLVSKPVYLVFQVSVRRQRTAFPPNFVHSLDGSHMMMTAVACKRAGLNFAGAGSILGTGSIYVKPLRCISVLSFHLYCRRPWFILDPCLWCGSDEPNSSWEVCRTLWETYIGRGNVCYPMLTKPYWISLV